MSANTSNINNNIIERNVSFVLNVITSSDAIIDVTGDVLDIDIDYDINGFPHGTLLLNDIDNNIFYNYNITQGDALILVLSSGTSENLSITKGFIINSIKPLSKDIKIANAHNKYKISFMSAILYHNMLTTISRGYPGSITTSNVVTDILTKDFLYEKESLKDILKSNTILDDYIITYRKPLDELNFLKKISSGDVEKDIFMFYEDHYGVKFLPLDMLLKQIPKYKVNKDVNPSLTETGIPIIRVLTEKFESGINISNTINTGGIWNRCIHFDRDTKEIIEKTYTFDEDFLNQITTLGSNANITKKNVLDCVQPNLNIIREDGKYGEKLSYYNMRINMLNNYVYKITTNGMLDISLGHILYVNFLLKDSLLNTSLSGGWLVSHIKWKISNRDKSNKSNSYPTFKMDITLMKDTFNISDNTSLLSTNQNVNTTT